MPSLKLSRARSQDASPDGGRSTGVLIVLVAQLMLVLDATVVNVALPHISTDLGFTPAGLSWVLNGYTLAFGGLLLLGGRLGDVYGRRRVFGVGLAVFTLFSLLGGLATSPELLVSARALQGIGAALAAPNVLALLTTSAPDEAGRNRAFALFAAVSSGGGTLGLLLGGVLTDLVSWRWTLFINVPIGLAVLALVGRFVAETPRRPGRFDVVGAVTATGGAVSVVWALINAGEHGWGKPTTVLGLVVGALLLAALGVTEARVAHPLLRLGLLRSHRRVAALVGIAAVFGAQMSMFFLMVQYLEIRLGFGPLASGVAFLPAMVGVFAMSRVTPQLVQRFGQVPLIVVGTTGLAVSFAWMSLLGPSSTYAGGVLLPMVLDGIAAGLTMMPLTSLVLGGVEPEHAGAASGLMQTMQQLGGAVGLAVVASVYAARTVGHDVLSGLDEALLASTTLSLLALLSILTVVGSRLGRSRVGVGMAD